MKLNFQFSPNNRLSPAQLQRIFYALTPLGILEELTLMNAPLNKVAFDSLLNCIETSPLTRLQLTGTLLDNNSQKRLAAVVQTHATLRHFHWSHGELSTTASLNLHANLTQSISNRPEPKLAYTPYLDLAVKPELKKKEASLDHLGVDTDLPVLPRRMI